jgi:hypothetical protein
MAGEQSRLHKALEPEAETAVDPHHAALASIAVSLKQIADVLDGTAVGLCVTETIFGRNRDVR